MSTRRFAAVVTLCLVLAAVLRVPGLGHGWPQNYIPDTTAVRAALSLGAGANPFAGDPLPTQYPYFLPYLLAAIYGAFFVAGWLVGSFASVAAFETWAYDNPQYFFLIAAAVSALFGCALVWLVSSVTQRLLDRRAALFAAVFTATSLLLVQLSQQARPHLAAIALIFCSLGSTLRHLETGRGGWTPWLFAGLAASAVPYALLSLAIPAVGTLGIGSRRGRVANLAGGMAIFLALQVLFYPRFVVGDPVAYDPSTGLIRSYGGLYLMAGSINGRGFPKLAAWIVASEPVLVALVVCGIAAALLRRRRPDLRWAVTGVFPLLYVLVYGSYEVIHPRYLAPLIPFLSIPAGWVAAQWQNGIARATAERFGSRAAALASAAFVVVLFLLPLAQALRFDQLVAREDTRRIAETWIAEHLRHSNLIATEAHGVELPLDARALGWAAAHHPDRLGLRDRNRVRAVDRGQLIEGYPVLRLWDLDDYEEKNVTALASYAQNGHVVAVLRGDAERDDPFYRSLRRDGRLLLRLSPLRPGVERADTRLPVELQRPLWDLWKVERAGPIIEIYEWGRS